MIQITLEGGKQLERKLKAIERKVGKKIVRKGVREGLKPTHKATKSNAQSMVGGEMGALLSKNLVLRAFKKQRRGSYAMSVRTKADVEAFVHTTKEGRRYYIPAAIEHGHAKPGRGGGKSPPKDVPAIPFMRTASDANLEKGVPIFAKVVKTEIEAVAKRGS